MKKEIITYCSLLTSPEYDQIFVAVKLPSPKTKLYLSPLTFMGKSKILSGLAEHFKKTQQNTKTD